MTTPAWIQSALLSESSTSSSKSTGTGSTCAVHHDRGDGDHRSPPGVTSFSPLSAATAMEIRNVVMPLPYPERCRRNLVRTPTVLWPMAHPVRGTTGVSLLSQAG